MTEKAIAAMRALATAIPIVAANKTTKYGTRTTKYPNRGVEYLRVREQTKVLDIVRELEVVENVDELYRLTMKYPWQSPTVQAMIDEFFRLATRLEHEHIHDNVRNMLKQRGVHLTS